VSSGYLIVTTCKNMRVESYAAGITVFYIFHRTFEARKRLSRLIANPRFTPSAISAKSTPLGVNSISCDVNQPSLPGVLPVTKPLQYQPLAFELTSVSKHLSTLWLRISLSPLNRNKLS
jgi:hypothetical protein